MVSVDIKTFFRNFRKNRFFTVINVLSLAVGLACFMVISLWVDYELSHDTFNKNLDNIYKLSYKNRGYVLPGPLAGHLKKNFPEIKEATPYLHRGACKLTVGNQGYFADGSYVKNSAFNIFTLPVIKGNSEKLLENPNSIVLTASLAERLFGTDDPIGKSVTVADSYLDSEKSLTVTGVIENLPKNTHMKIPGENHFDFLLPFELTKKWVQAYWGVNMMEAYVLAETGTDIEALNSKIAGVVKSFEKRITSDISLVPLKDVYLYGLEGGGRIHTVYLFSFIAFFILIIACINYINLSTVRSDSWYKQIAVKKIMGATKLRLVRFFLLESILFAYISIFAAILIADLIIPQINDIADTGIKLTFSIEIIAFIFLLPLVAGVGAGLYPAFVLSAGAPVANVQAKKGLGGRGFGKILRNGLVIFQFSLSVILIIAGLTMHSQNRFMQNRSLGYSSENVLIVRMRGELQKSYGLVKKELQRLPEVVGVSGSGNPVVHRWWTNGGLKWEGQKAGEEISFGLDVVGYDFDKVLGIEMKEGRFLSEEFTSDSKSGVVVNEAAVKAMKMDKPIGKFLSGIGKTDYRIVGVMRDFNTESVHEKIKPHAYFFSEQGYNYMYVKFRRSKAGIGMIVDRIKATVQGVVASDPFYYSFLDNKVRELYEAEILTARMINLSTVVTLIISCLGLMGLAFYTAKKQIKEICIRKVLGGSVSGLVLHLSKSTMKWIVIANIVACPIALVLSDKWMQNFAYRADLTVWPFISALGITMFVALGTIIYQTLKSVSVNPVEHIHVES